jgi:cytochrome b
MKNTALKFLNPILLILLIIAFVSMLLYRFGGGSEKMGQTHAWAGLFFFFVGILHLICNWGWVRANIFKRRKRQ